MQARALGNSEHVDEKTAQVEIATVEGSNVKVRAYGRLAELLGREREIGVEMPCTVAELRTRLAVECPEAAASLDNRRVLACVGDELVPGNYTVAAGETVEFFSPVSGG